MGKSIVLGLLACSMFFNMGCDSSDVAAGAVGVGIGIGVGRHYERERDRDRWERDHWGRDRWGRDRWGRGGYRECGYYGCYAADVGTVDGNTVDMDAQATSNLAKKYGISNKAGAKIEAAFGRAAEQGVSAFETIGLDQAAVLKLAQKQMPSDASMKAMSSKLDMSEAQSRDMVKAMIAEFNAQAKDVNSDYWQACMAKGTWKTGQNTNCSDASWKGCSPTTGANFCY